MQNNKLSGGFAALFFSREDEYSAMYVPTPPPEWICGNGRSSLCISESGMFCLYFLIFSKPHGSAVFTVNGRDISGSYAREKGGEICSSAICSIKEGALPCSLGINTLGETSEGVLLIIKCNV